MLFSAKNKNRCLNIFFVFEHFTAWNLSMPRCTWLTHSANENILLLQIRFHRFFDEERRSTQNKFYLYFPALVLYKWMSSLGSCSVSVIYWKSASVSLREKRHYLVLMVKTAVSLGKRMYQPSLKMYDSLAFTTYVKGLH